jgi:hypothetical protein
VSEALIVTLSLVLNAALPYFIVKHDLVRLNEERLARAWTDASFLSAVIPFGPLSLPVHFTKTRRSLRGLGLGVGLCAAAFVAQGLVVAGSSWVLGVGQE